jgi:Alpha/beta hydrolase domain
MDNHANPEGASMRNALRTVTLLLALAGTAQARVVDLQVTNRADVAGGKSFGTVGPYEKIVGKVRYAVRIDNPHNQRIVDLDLAPRNAAGEVEFSADFFLLRPKDASRGNGAMIVEIPNRGGKGIVAIVNGARGSLDPATEAELGDGFLMNRGFEVAWIGWQWDVRSEPNRMKLDAPVAIDHGKPIEGQVRSDFVVADKVSDEPLGHMILGAIGGTEYPAAEPASRKNTLTVRDAPMSERKAIPRSQWHFSADGSSIHLDGAGFQPGKIYELIYLARNPRVAGLGFAAVRDFVSYVKHGAEGVAPRPVPHQSVVYGVGISQSGRFLRDLVYQGFNADEQGRQVFDGLIPHVAGAGRGNFNYRFAQPSRDAQPMNALLYATDLYPFADLPLLDPASGRKEGLLDRATAENVAPKIFYTNTSYEYWSRAASLIHTTPDGTADAPIPDNVRIYLDAGLQHFSGPFPPAVHRERELAAVHPQSPLAVRWFWRSMLVNLDAWVRGGLAPPASRYPKIADGTLVTLPMWKFPTIPGVTQPRDVHRAWHVDFGPDFGRGIVSRQPPAAREPFVSLVPQVDADGNDVAGIRLPELAAPLATCTGWNLRDPAVGAPWARVSFLGSYLPFARTADERQKSGDPRLSIAERYPSRDAWLGRFTAAALDLVRDRYVLAEDLDSILRRGTEEWEYANR